MVSESLDDELYQNYYQKRVDEERNLGAERI